MRGYSVRTTAHPCLENHKQKTTDYILSKRNLRARDRYHCVSLLLLEVLESFWAVLLYCMCSIEYEFFFFHLQPSLSVLMEVLSTLDPPKTTPIILCAAKLLLSITFHLKPTLTPFFALSFFLAHNWFQRPRTVSSELHCIITFWRSVVLPFKITDFNI